VDKLLVGLLAFAAGVGVGVYFTRQAARNKIRAGAEDAAGSIVRRFGGDAQTVSTVQAIAGAAADTVTN